MEEDSRKEDHSPKSGRMGNSVTPEVTEGNCRRIKVKDKKNGHSFEFEVHDGARGPPGISPFVQRGSVRCFQPDVVPLQVNIIDFPKEQCEDPIFIYSIGSLADNRPGGLENYFPFIHFSQDVRRDRASVTMNINVGETTITVDQTDPRLMRLFVDPDNNISFIYLGVLDNEQKMFYGKFNNFLRSFIITDMGPLTLPDELEIDNTLFPVILYHRNDTNKLYSIFVEDTINTYEVTGGDVPTGGKFISIVCLSPADRIFGVAFYDDVTKNLCWGLYNSGWTSKYIVSSSDDTGKHCKIIVDNGIPTVFYHNATRNTIEYIKSKDIFGNEWENPVVFRSEVNVDNISMLMNEGRIFILFYDINSQSVYFISPNGEVLLRRYIPNVVELIVSSVVIQDVKVPIIFLTQQDVGLLTITGLDSEGRNWSPSAIIDRDMENYRDLTLIGFGRNLFWAWTDKNDKLSYNYSTGGPVYDINWMIIEKD